MRYAAIVLLAWTATAQERTIAAGADVRGLSFSPDAQALYGICADSKVRRWDPRSGDLRSSTDLNMAERPAGAQYTLGVLALAAPGAMSLTDLATGAALRKIPIGDYRVMQVAVAPDGRAVAGASRVAGNSREEVMRMWDESGQARFAVPSGIGGTSASAISPDGTLLAAGSWDTDLRVWSTRNGELVKLIEDLPVAMFAVAFSPDGRNFAAAGVDRTIYIWDAKTWKLERKLAGQPEMIASLAFSADGKSLATGGFNDITMKHPVSVLVWDFMSGKVVKTLPAPHAVRAVALSNDGKLLAAASLDAKVRLWELR